MPSPTPESRRPIAMALVAAAVFAAGQEGLAQDAGSLSDLRCPKADEPVGPLTNGGRMLGIDRTCRNCHELGQPGASIFTPARSDDPWVLRNEFVTWQGKGRHYQAFATLEGKRSKAMGAILGVEDVSRDARCLACHSSAPIEWIESGRAAVDELLEGPRSDILYAGVSCEACHGASGDWNAPHQDSATWRDLSPKDKQDRHGYYDVRSPASRAHMCVSCHIGDPERGRIVTHEMYAAGHPPLPAFEVETFLRDMPPHWRVLGPERSLDDRADTIPGKGEEITREFIAGTEDPYFAKLREKEGRGAYDAYVARYDRTRSLAVGAIVTWAQGARVTAALASETDHPVSPAADRWPELASFECSACHHGLELSGWRAQRDPPTTPGRPLLRDWSSPLFKAVCALFTRQKTVPPQVEEMTRFLDTATRDDPYGDRAEISSRLFAAAKEADGWAGRVERQPFSRNAARTLLKSIATVAAERDLDYESARNLMWGFEEVLRELAQKRGLNSDLRVAADRFDAVKQMFVTDLATTNVRSVENVEVRGLRAPLPTQTIDLSVVHEAAAAYDARRFREGMAEVGAALN